MNKTINTNVGGLSFNLEEDAYKSVADENLKIEYKITKVEWDTDSAQKGGYAHFMMKEMYEEPKVFDATIRPRIKDNEIYLEHFPVDKAYLDDINKINIIACGTAYHAGCVGKSLIEKLCRIPVVCGVASEFIYSDPIIDEHTLTIVISQSGETLDTIIKIVRITHGTDNNYHYGAIFVGMNDTDASKIEIYRMFNEL